jgi:hypothetical protein
MNLVIAWRGNTTVYATVTGISSLFRAGRVAAVGTTVGATLRD